MRQVIVSNIISVDGYYEGPGRNVMVLNMDEAFDAYNLERIPSGQCRCAWPSLVRGVQLLLAWHRGGPRGSRQPSSRQRQPRAQSDLQWPPEDGCERQLRSTERQPLAFGNQVRSLDEQT